MDSETPKGHWPLTSIVSEVYLSPVTYSLHPAGGTLYGPEARVPCHENSACGLEHTGQGTALIFIN